MVEVKETTTTITRHEGEHLCLLSLVRLTTDDYGKEEIAMMTSFISLLLPFDFRGMDKQRSFG